MIAPGKYHRQKYQQKQQCDHNVQPNGITACTGSLTKKPRHQHPHRRVCAQAPSKQNTRAVRIRSGVAVDLVAPGKGARH